MSFDNIVTLAGAFKETSELKEYCDAQYKALEVAAKRIQELQDENEHLKKLLGGAVPLVEPTVVEPQLEVPAEQAICEMQIKRLQKTAMERDLTIEETKRLDLLVKNLYLAKGIATNITENRNQFGANISTDQLLQIASTPE